MKINDCIKLSGNLTRLFRRLPVVLISLLVLCVTSCRSPNGLTRMHRSDSLQSIKRAALTLMPVPPDTTAMKIPEAKLTMLPTGAGYSTRSGRATVNVRRTDDGDIEVTAICDSLARQVIILEEELTRIRNETGKEEKPPGVVREPTGWQWFQIWTGRIAVICLILIVIKRRFYKTKK